MLFMSKQNTRDRANIFKLRSGAIGTDAAIPVQKASSSVIETRYVPGVHFNSGFYFLLAYTKLTNTLHRRQQRPLGKSRRTPTTRPLCSGEHALASPLD